MTALILQTMLLLALAYLLGSMAGCFLRKFFPADHVTSPRPQTGQYSVPVGTAAGAAVAVGGAAVATASRNARAQNYQIPTVSTPAPTVAPTVTRPTPPVQQPRPAVAPTVTPPTPPRPVVATVPPVQSGQSMNWKDDNGAQIRDNNLHVPAKPVAPTVAPVSDDFLTEKTAQASTFSTHSQTTSSQTSGYKDDLTRIKGLGSILALKLNKLGITRLDQVARWTQNDILAVNSQLEFSGRIEREDWIGQAKRLISGQEAVVDGTTAHVKPVQTKSYFPSGEQTIKLDAVSSLSLPVSGPPEDLKRIAGIGVVVEEQLNAIGYTHYLHIQSLTPYDIREISRHLEFTGRIEREDWMGQAERLAKGAL